MYTPTTRKANKKPTRTVSPDQAKERLLKRAMINGISTGQLEVADGSATLTAEATPEFITSIASLLPDNTIFYPGISAPSLSGKGKLTATITPDGRNYHDLLVKMQTANRIIDEKYSHVHDLLGAPVSTLQDGANDGYYKTYERGAIYLSPKGWVFEVHGAIYQRYLSLRAEKGLLGYPATDETTASSGEGRFNHFEKGSIYWSPATGAWEIHGLIRDKWLTLWADRSFLGFPISNEENYNVSDGRISQFQRGSIIFLWGNPDLIVTSDAVIYKKDGDEQGVVYHVELWMNSKGDWRYTGHMRNKNAFAGHIRISTNPRFHDAAGNIFYATVLRDPATIFEFGSSTSDWDQVGSGDQFIIDNWDTLKYVGIDVHVEAKVTLGDIIEIITIGAIPGIYHGIEAIPEIDMRICGAYQDERMDPNTGEDDLGTSFDAQDSEDPCQRG